jgi:hypothetical protein
MSDKPGDEINPTPPTEPTEPMEVHHHSHSHGKGWKAYTFEFFMLFLAVFCGFLAEYMLEHKIEKERGMQFVESFYEDLKTDTARIATNIAYDEEKIIGMEQINGCYAAMLQNPKNDTCLLNIIRYSSINRPFMRTDRTLKQLANAGGYRLLKKADADSILAYEKACDDFHDFQSTVFQAAQDNVRSTFNNVISFSSNAQMFRLREGRAINTASFSPDSVTGPLLLSADKTLLNKYFNELLLYYRITYNHRTILLNLKAEQTKLIAYFKKKYDFE